VRESERSGAIALETSENFRVLSLVVPVLTGDVGLVFGMKCTITDP